MTSNDLRPVAEAVVRRAREHGFVLRREVRAELAAAGLSESLWKDVVGLAGPSLRYRGGRYYHADAASDRARRQRDQQQVVRRAVRQIVRAYRSAARADERREESRVDFIQPVRVHTEDGRSFTLLSRDLSATGIRLIGTHRLLGQRVRVAIAPPGRIGAAEAAGEGWSFVVRILWTCAVGDDLFENGGTFLEAGPAP